MRIHLNLPTPGCSSSSSSATAGASTSPSSTALSSAPTPLTALTPNGELILIELQGSLEIENQSPTGGQVLGTISFESSRPDRPILMISHHRLEGKFVNLVRPLAVLEKKVRPDKVLSDVANKRRSEAGEGEGEIVGSVKRAKRGEERGSSPAVEGRRARDALDFSSSPPRPIAKARVGMKSDRLVDIDENGAPIQETEAAQGGAQGENRDEKVEEEEEDEEEPQTAVYYDVVSVIKRKILFSKRPEPIVRLDSSSITASTTTTKT